MTTTTTARPPDGGRALFNVKLSSPDGTEYEGPVAAQTPETALVIAGAAARRAGFLLTGATQARIRRVWHTVTPAGDAGLDVTTAASADTGVAAAAAQEAGYEVLAAADAMTLVILTTDRELPQVRARLTEMGVAGDALRKLLHLARTGQQPRIPYASGSLTAVLSYAGTPGLYTLTSDGDGELLAASPDDAGQDFTVCWDIDTFAATHRDAARDALATIRDPLTDALTFGVAGADGRVRVVNLGGDPCDDYWADGADG